VSALQDLLGRYRTAAPTHREQGTYFEELTVSYLKNEPAYKELYRDVVPYAEWARRPELETGIPGFVLRPPVLGPGAVPVVTDPAEAARRPELAVLSALAHGEGELGAAIAAAVLPAVAALGDDRARFYGDLVLNSLNEAARRALEAMMKGYEYQSDFAKKYVAQGETSARARDVLTVLRVRSVEVPDIARERILTEKDPVRLERWLEKAAVALSVADVIDDPS
jgi:hypothetical protein